MPPVDITRSYYGRPATFVRQNVVAVLIEHWRLGSGVAMDAEQPVKVATTAIIIRQANTALIQSPGVRRIKHHPCHYRHQHHRHEHQGLNHASSIPSANHSSTIAGLAASELGFLTISLALSILLLLIGYKIGNRVCRYELLRNNNRGRGHKSSRVRRVQVASPLSGEKQPLFLEDDLASNEHYDDLEPESDVFQIVAEPRAAWTYK
ncbi:hypothetical protein IWW38_001444 [Coemansia aciculifera]|uniref:Uncharacterized protein n=1 Tax=Coemansia aciculifera TaxID=417176 RepID=A0ACC1M7Z5_9FUNG|nr:hypothetical protein IWW38_001444 [Coemansia aciculifera]